MAVTFIPEGKVNAEGSVCASCGHACAHRLFTMDGDPEPWSWCGECGGRCEFVAADEPSPDFAVAPLGDLWTVYDEVANSIRVPALSLVDAELVRQALIDLPGRIVEFAWREVA